MTIPKLTKIVRNLGKMTYTLQIRQIHIAAPTTHSAIDAGKMRPAVSGSGGSTVECSYGFIATYPVILAQVLPLLPSNISNIRPQSQLLFRRHDLSINERIVPSIEESCLLPVTVSAAQDSATV